MYAVIDGNGQNRLATQTNDVSDTTFTATTITRMSTPGALYKEAYTTSVTMSLNTPAPSTITAGNYLGASNASSPSTPVPTHASHDVVTGLGVGLTLGLLCLSLAATAAILFRKFRREHLLRNELQTQYARLETQYKSATHTWTAPSIFPSSGTGTIDSRVPINELHSNHIAQLDDSQKNYNNHRN